MKNNSKFYDKIFHLMKIKSFKYFALGPAVQKKNIHMFSNTLRYNLSSLYTSCDIYTRIPLKKFQNRKILTVAY